MTSRTATARARASCHRCHKRKKRCDRSLPFCTNCHDANVRCSFLDDDCQTASYPIAYVRNMERRLRELEQRFASDQPTDPPSAAMADDSTIYGTETSTLGVDVSTLSQQELPSALENTEPSDSSPQQARPVSQARSQVNNPSIFQEPVPPSFVGELETLSLEATAERHLGSTSGISFARLTQLVLRRLSPDRADFVFINDQENYSGSRLFAFDSPSDLMHPSLFESLNKSISIHPALFGDVVLADDVPDPSDPVADLCLPSDQSHVDRLVDFYFSHSNTLYPILYRSEIVESLRQIRLSPDGTETHPPLSLFRIWMVLAIGSTAYCSVALSEESEARLYYNKALEYLEQASAYGDMNFRHTEQGRCHSLTDYLKATLEVIMLQVSFSFFNQLGPSWSRPDTWFLVGLAARLALGMGLHTSGIYVGMPVDMVQRRKRIFFSIYMMDRVVSTALGRPFALHDDDIDTTPFAPVDDDCIRPDGILPQRELQPSLMAIPLHIVQLRRIAGKIAKQVYSNSQVSSLTMEQRNGIIRSLHQELIDWRRSMPFPLPDINDRVPHLTTNWFDFNFYTHLALLYRPSPLLPTMDQERVKTLMEAASMSLRQAFNMHRQHRLSYNWLNLLSLFTATLSLIYSTTVQPDDLVIILKETKAIDDLDLAIELFDTLGTKFPAANKIRGMIEEISRRYKDLRDSTTR
ncbi:GAL4 [Geosmithia morbida]|uniref:GAL4 n=1 Tax=Geosmithia morbida TaxID=1094350 RepID=A0A9P4YZQ0_9HYPO|nr:GAL4 [Geosmithia morbida]KAF4124736.1 GAL4 [Geosmithia morbida]